MALVGKPYMLGQTNQKTWDRLWAVNFVRTNIWNIRLVTYPEVERQWWLGRGWYLLDIYCRLSGNVVWRSDRDNRHNNSSLRRISNSLPPCSRHYCNFLYRDKCWNLQSPRFKFLTLVSVRHYFWAYSQAANWGESATAFIKTERLLDSQILYSSAGSMKCTFQRVVQSAVPFLRYHTRLMSFLR